MSPVCQLKVSVLGLAFGAGLLASATQAFEAPAAPLSDAVSTASVSERITGKRELLYAMQRDACFKMAGVEGTDFAARVSASVAHFGTMADTLAAEGDSTGLDTALQSDLNLFEQYWKVLAPALQQISAGDFHSVPVQQALRLEPEAQRLLRSIQDRLDQDADDMPAAADDRAQAIAAQKVRVQKMTKDACFVLRDIKTADARADLQVTLAAFDSANAALVAGATGAGTSPEDRLAAAWQSYGALIAELEHKVSVSNDAKLRLAALSETLMAQLDLLENAAPDGQQAKPLEPNRFMTIFNKQLEARG